MIGMITNDTTKTLEKAMDAAWLRNEVISQNIANVDTPGYKRKTVAFEEQLNEAMNRSIRGRMTNERHIPIGRRNIDRVSIGVKDDSKLLSMRLDGNNVDIENEMAGMAKNTIKYNVLTQRISDTYRRIKSVIREGR